MLPERKRYKHIDRNLSEDDIRNIENLIASIRNICGAEWGFVLDVKDNIAQVLRCIYSDTAYSGLRPVIAVPFTHNLNWRSEAMESESPIIFDEVDLNDPRSFYLRKTVQSSRLALFPIKADSNISLLSMFARQEETQPLTQPQIQDIDLACRKLLPLVQNQIWKREQEILDEATKNIRRQETPKFICELFNRLLERPIYFLEKLATGTYNEISRYGFDDDSPTERIIFNLSPDPGQVFFRAKWQEITKAPSKEPEAMLTGIYLKPGKHVLLVAGDLLLRGRAKDDLFHYIEHISELLSQPPYQISTLTFLLHLQHWVRSKDHDTNVIFQHIIDTLVPFLNADYGALALLDPEKKRLMFVSQAGDWVNPIKNMPLEDENGHPTSILSFVRKENRAYLTSDVSKDPYYHAFTPSIRSEMGAPIRVRGEIIGLFTVSSKELAKFKKQDLAKLEFFCDQIGIALFQAGILDKALVESEQARKLDQEIKFGVHRNTHAKDVIYNFGNLVGSESGAMAPVFEAIRKINTSQRDDLNVLITGETGSGKEMVAFALHNTSHRKDRPMVVANFASFGGDPNLIQSELFGHEKGSFSGATNRRIGCIEQGHNTTLLIDEIGDIVPSVQIKLLRVMQQSRIKTFQRLGGQEHIRSDVRILAATHKDLWKEVTEGRFREDLYYRLHTLVIRIPPLRERLEDIPQLVAHFSAKYEREVEGLKLNWTKDAVEALQTYHWPGNVRQLEAVINRALVLYSEDGLITGTSVEESLQHEHHHGPGMTASVSSLRTNLFKEVCDSGDNAFWDLIHKPYRAHQITQEDLRNLIKQGLTATRGSYKQTALLMGVSEKDYNKFLDFLKNSDAKPDYRPFRR